ncbi:MAG TPA: YbhB/YbcL family Raf kinase inhibitor-like protein [Rhizomicrobium sp.]|nr:YbhB/YbcL family Raf kinase inhibitor-like protein [Rhizomicrobium sp.]
MKPLIAAASLLILAAGPAFAQAPAQGQSPHPNALVEFPAKGGAKLTVITPAFQNNGDIPYENTQYRGNIFPGLSWSAGPAGTKSYAVIMQDTGGTMRDGYPILHWTLWNVPANVTKLDAGMAPTGNPSGSAYGPNMRGAAQPYTGPRTPAGPKHPYHLQVFALDTTIPVDASATYVSLTSAMKDHILASGEVVGMGSVDPNAPPPAPRPAPAR